MSLAINIDKVRRVLLADGWHDCDLDDTEGPESSFWIDSYEFVTGTVASRATRSDTLLGGGEEDLIPARGFGFVSSGAVIVGPLNSILAVEVRQ